MKTIILPGFSVHNREWAQQAKEALSSFGDVVIHEWRHWHTNNQQNSFVEDETQRILGLFENEPVSILAKSIGTYFAMKVVKTMKSEVYKIILCGIALSPRDMSEEERGEFSVLSEISPDKVICFQNQNDPHGGYESARKMIWDVNSGIKVVQKLRDDHEYPYFEDFRKFLEA